MRAISNGAHLFQFFSQSSQMEKVAFTASSLVFGFGL
jgi:hypothetical protein